MFFSYPYGFLYFEIKIGYNYKLVVKMFKKFIFVCILLIISFKFYADSFQDRLLIFTTKRIVNIGDVKQGEKINHVFEFVNNSKYSLNIVDVSKSCTCTSFRLSKSLLKLGEKCSIKLMVDTDGKIGNQNVMVSFRTDVSDMVYIVKLQYKSIIDKKKT
jgi:Protein of unknown function (DUF1573).